MKKLTILLILICQSAYAGSIIAWGDCETGQCGVIDLNEPPDFGLPFPDGNDFIDIALSSYNGFAVRETGEIIGWGRFAFDNLLENIPDGNYVAIDAGDNHAIALDNEGYLTAWGYNGQGQCDVSTEPNWVKVAANYRTTAALKNDGTIGVWGKFPDDVNEPSGNDYVDVKVGDGFIVALKEDGTITGWGNNSFGTISRIPEGTFTAIGCGQYYCMAIREDGSIEGWGQINYINEPPEGNDFLAVDCGWHHVLAIKKDDSLFAWGLNDKGQCDVPDVCDIYKISVCFETNLALNYESDKQYVLTINVEPNDINTVSPGVGDFYYYAGESLAVDAERCPICPYVWTFDYWTGDIGDPNKPFQFIKMNEDKTITAHYRKLDRVCGDECHPILQGDINGDCYINFDDFAIYAASWLACTHPDCD